MEAMYKVLLLSSFTLMCLVQLSASTGAALVQVLDYLPPPPGTKCSWWGGCNKKHTRCMEWANGCGKKMKTCECKDGYMLDPTDDICKHFREVNSKCTIGNDICPVGSTCTGSPTKCTCTSGIHSKDEEVCGRRYDETCTADSECSNVRGPQTCKSGVCACGTGTEYQKEMGKKCLPKSGTACTLHAHCYGKQYCDAGACRCPTGQKFDTDSFQCVASNALTNVARGSECTPSKTTSEARVCAYGLHCFPCNEILNIWKCVEFPTAAATRPVQTAVLLSLALLMALLV